MGALHAGHRSLLERARRENASVAASLFVNPLQFGPSEDFERYPRSFESDVAQFEAAGVDLRSNHKLVIANAVTHAICCTTFNL